MRVIAGKYRGKKLHMPKGAGIRPTTDRAKESLFNMVQNKIYGAKFLDLFSGSGAISMEACSRGADQITLVENNRESLQLIEKNIGLLGEEKARIRVERTEVLRFLKNTKEQYTIIFADPPYKYACIDMVASIVKSRSLLAKEGILIMETQKDVDIEIPEGMYVEKSKIYAISKFTLIKEIE